MWAFTRLLGHPLKVPILIVVPIQQHLHSGMQPLLQKRYPAFVLGRSLLHGGHKDFPKVTCAGRNATLPTYELDMFFEVRLMSQLIYDAADGSNQVT